MTDTKKVFCCLILCMLIVGCAQIPSSESPIEVQKVFYASFDDIWDNSIKTIETFSGPVRPVIAKDKTAGLITCKIPDRKSGAEQYINVYIRRENREDRLCGVYVVPYACSTYGQYAVSGDPKEKVMFVFQDVFFRKNHLSEIGNTFFERLASKFKERRL